MWIFFGVDIFRSSFIVTLLAKFLMTSLVLSHDTIYQKQDANAVVNTATLPWPALGQAHKFSYS